MIPTPTPLPPPSATLAFNLSSTSWGAEMSSNAIQAWNMGNQDGLGTQVQIFIILVIVVLGVGAIVAALNRL